MNYKQASKKISELKAKGFEARIVHEGEGYKVNAKMSVISEIIYNLPEIYNGASFPFTIDNDLWTVKFDGKIEDGTATNARIENHFGAEMFVNWNASVIFSHAIENDKSGKLLKKLVKNGKR